MGFNSGFKGLSVECPMDTVPSSLKH